MGSRAAFDVETEVRRELAATGLHSGDRLVSLDVFRGATIAAMLLVNDPGTWSAVYAPLLHAPWHGWTFTDVIFPFFLWITGMALTLSAAKRLSRGASRFDLLLHAFRRSVIIFAIGLFLAGYPFFNFAIIRIPGVLQRIAVCYLIAAAIYLTTSVRGQIRWTISFLAIYWLLMKLYPVPGYGPGILEKEGNFAQYIDSLILSGHMWATSKTWDPEGVVSTLPAIATTLFGVLTGHLLRIRKSPEEKTAWIFVLGNALLFTGAVMSLWLPINKNLWTSSYSIFMAGLAANVFAFCYLIIDVKGYTKWTLPFRAYGMNAILIYFGQQVVDFYKIAGFFLSGVARTAAAFGPLIIAIGALAAKWLVLRFLYGQRVFFKV